jgi:ATP-dependent DNA helicase RecG
VAEHDLALRGPGELLGTRQHGYSDFRVVDIFRDMPVYKKIKNYFNNCNFNEIEPIVWKEINFRFPNLLQGLKI